MKFCSPLTIPQPLRCEIKRQAFQDGIPTIGTIAVDVNVNRIYSDVLIIDAYEHRPLLTFETFFNISVWFACFPPGQQYTCHLFLNRDQAGLGHTGAKRKAMLTVPLKMTRPADERRDFMAAVMGAISLR